jgi:peroxiredoxin
MRELPSARRLGFLAGTLLWGAVCLYAADIPRPVPATTFRTPDGGQIDLSKYKGKVIALEFLLTTCPHCQRCSSTMQKLYRELGDRGFQPVGVATNEMAHMLIGDYVKKLGLTYPIGFTAYDVAVQWLQHPAMLTMYMPQLVLIDRKGMIRAQFPGEAEFYKDEESNMRKEVEALLKEPAAGAAKPAGKKATKKAS